MYIIIRKICVKIIEERMKKIRKVLDEHEKLSAEYIKVGNYKKANEIESQIKLDKEMLDFIGKLYIVFLY